MAKGSRSVDVLPARGQQEAEAGLNVSNERVGDNSRDRGEKLSRTQVYFWYKRFKDGRKSIADDSRSGRPLTSTMDRNIGQVRDLIVADIKITI
ncbi:hypothetical protein LAZ67_9002345 [Cordylochernes scorpioides]|uniref:Mos1 transposase HTH domain-containing protein n=1 Tax=Cordylochernes scorpioides TaxID=51811 RepID=A0ABY6KTQ9_9ARAC|nr:hypothetical protein LAZ67_9002345 [Cordylochernes scorpioides]